MFRLFLFLLFLTTTFAQAQKTDTRLQKQLETLVKDFHGDLGIYVEDLKTHSVAAIRADTIFPTASIVKVPILLGIMDKIQRGQLDYHQSVTLTDSLRYKASDEADLVNAMKTGEKIEISRLLLLMLSTSDNTASLWLQGLAGGGLRINQVLDSLGYQVTRVNSRTPGREAIRNRYGWGQTSPREMARLFTAISERKLINPSISEKMLRLLGRQYWDQYALSQIPPDVFVADKHGCVNQSRSEVFYVAGPHPYVCAIFTKNNRDESWEATNEAWTLTRKISALLWKYYHPRSTWIPDSKNW
ncbi:serine hydrolase [Siphonobacter sp. BAB-5405]|uniref:serine hydrolase n=1 Tax=Siphonobacter sp. BAB-5405 TaxID=1864825 RepID=UPI000C803C31|nr:serine hydrolase [Siphonobacter sp. BAB-5405]PMD90756.1 serine hydrolase [Siphonobacter sp. BAB-5405]